MDIMSLVGCLLGFVLMGVLTYVGWNVMISSLVGALAAAVFSGLDITSAYLNLYLSGMGTFLTQYFGMFLFGAILAELFSQSGAAMTIALGVSKICFKESYSPKTKRHMVIVSLILISSILEYAGVGASLVVLVLYPVALSLYKMADIPKKYIVAGILGGCVGFANALPGSPQAGNVIPMQILGTTPYAALVPGLIAAVIELMVMTSLVNILITRDVNRGEHFEFGPEDKVFDDDRARPSIWMTLIPMVSLFILFNFVGLNINIALALTCIIAAITFYRYFPNRDVKSVVSEGALASLPASISICAVMGFSRVIQSAPAFNQVVAAISGWQINPYILLFVTVAIMCALCGGSATGQAIAIPIIAPIVQKMGVSAAAIHRISAFAGATLDTMPYAGTVVMAHAYADVKIRDGYPAVFMITVVATTISSSVVTILCALFPGLAV